jgi:hypothetical protein
MGVISALESPNPLKPSPRASIARLLEELMTSPANDTDLEREELNWEEALDWLFGELELCDCDPAESEWQLGYEAALRDFFSQLIGRDPSGTLH